MTDAQKPNADAVALTEGVGPLPERAAFEAWAKDQGFPLETLDGFDSDAVAYRDLRTHAAWEGFSVGVAAERERWAEAFVAARDAVLHDRGPLEDEGLDSDKTNAVLAVLDEAFAGLC